MDPKMAEKNREYEEKALRKALNDQHRTIQSQGYEIAKLKAAVRGYKLWVNTPLWIKVYLVLFDCAGYENLLSLKATWLFAE